MKKTVVITGGSEGLGFQIASILKEDYNTYILSTSEEKLKKASEELSCKYKVCDVTNWEQVTNTITAIENEAGAINVCINNAGVWLEGPLQENSPELIKKTLEVNLLGPIFITKAVISKMVENNSGLIININSQAALNSKAGRSVYYASKWGLNGFAKSVSLELSKNKVKIANVYPSLMNTKLFEKTGNSRDMSRAVNPADVAKAIKFMVEQPEEVFFPELGIANINY